MTTAKPTWSRRMSRSTTALLLAAAPGLALAGCAGTVARTPYTLADLSSANVLDNSPVRFDLRDDTARQQRWQAAWIGQRQGAGLSAPAAILAISGGSDRGAFSAGLLTAWSKRGDRPRFDLVTGVSVGALTAPFAFLGEEEDPALRAIWLGLDRGKVVRPALFKALTGGPAIGDTAPLQRLIASYVTDAFLDRIAEQHRAGRRLLVLTTNLDAQRGVVWDMGAIAASASPRRLLLFRQVLLASAAIPGAFPPVFVTATGGTGSFAEMHVDGGSTSRFFVLPEPMLRATPRPFAADSRTVILYNDAIVPLFEVVKPKAFTILGRGGTMVQDEYDRTLIDDLRRVTPAPAMLAVCALPPSKAVDGGAFLSKERLATLFSLGEQAVQSPSGCLDRPASRSSP